VSVKKETDANGNIVTRVVKKGVKDFNFGRTLGEGSYSTVCLLLVSCSLVAISNLLYIGSSCDGPDNTKRVRN
jgi:hypothetical protein